MHILLRYNKNIEENIKEARKLKFTPIILFKLILNKKDKIKEQLNQIKKLKKSYELTAVELHLEKQDNSTTGIINSLKQDFDIIIAQGGLNKENRFFLEDTNIDILKDPQNSLKQNKFDFIHHFNSGLNHVLTKIAKEKQINLMFSLNFTQNTSKLSFAKEIGRINQNIKFTRKYSVPININFIVENKNQIKTIIELKSILSLFKISEKQKQLSIELLENILKKNKLKKSRNYINQNIKIK